MQDDDETPALPGTARMNLRPLGTVQPAMGLRLGIAVALALCASAGPAYAQGLPDAPDDRGAEAGPARAQPGAPDEADPSRGGASEPRDESPGASASEPPPGRAEPGARADEAAPTSATARGAPATGEHDARARVRRAPVERAERAARVGGATRDRNALHPLRYTLEGIEVRGNAKTASRVVLRYVPLSAGDVLDVDDPAVELIRYRLLGTGFFKNVELSLAKGSEKGQVILVIEVEERNTIIVNDVWMGLAADADTRGEGRPLTAYAGVDVAETNLAGTGITLGGAMGLAQDQLALRVRFLDPSFLGSPLMTSGTLLFNDAQDFFGNDRVNWDDPNQTTGARPPDFAVAEYKRFGGSLGLGTDLSVPTQLWGHYRLERIDSRLPSSASHVRGTRGDIDTEPIDFDVLPGRSVLSTLSAMLQHDTRDHPVLPTRGWFSTFVGEASLAPLGSEYPYTRVDMRVSRWWRLPQRHVLRLEVFGGLISGDAPFFEQYYVGDLSDFRASRLLGLNVERRPAPNFFDTAVIEARYGEYAAKIDGEYRIPLYRGTRSIYGIDIFGSLGLFAIASSRDLEDPPGGYTGFQRVPIDFTANFGFRMDTSAGGFTLAFANALGFIPILEGR